MPILLYAGAAIVILAMLGGLGYKIRESGKDAVRLEWSAAVQKGKEEAEADRQRQDALRATQDKQATKRLTDAKRSNAALLTSLDAHIRVARLPADCRITEQLRGDVNAAIAGGQGVSPGTVPSGPGTSPPSR